MSENERAERCETCRFWESIDGKIEPGYCKRYPPRTSDALLLLNAISDTGRGVVSATFANADTLLAWEHGIRIAEEYASTHIQPVAWRNDWCGEWQPIGPQPAAKQPRETIRDTAMTVALMNGEQYKVIAERAALSPTAARMAILGLLQRRNPVVYQDGIQRGAFGDSKTPVVQYLRQHRRDFGF